MIVDLSDVEIKKEICSHSNISIYSVINIYTQEQQKMIKLQDNTSNIYIKDDDLETLKKIIVMFAQVIAPPVHMGDMFQAIELKEQMLNKQFYIYNVSKNTSGKEAFNSYEKIITRLKNGCEFNNASTVILFLYVGKNFSIFQENNIMSEVYNKCEEGTEIIVCTAFLEKSLLPDEMELIILRE